MIKPKFVIMHCSATPDFKKDEPNFDKFGAEDIHKWHLQRGFQKIGYHYVVRRSGEIQEGRKIDMKNALVEMGAHCKGENDKSIGVCYVGTSKPTTEQLNSLVSIYQIIYQIFGIEKEYWFPHRAFNPNKTCPGFDLREMKKLFINP